MILRLHSLIGLLLVASVLVCSHAQASNGEDGIIETSSNDEQLQTSQAGKVPSFLPAKSNLRFPNSAAIVQSIRKETALTDKMLAQVETLSDEAKVDLMEMLKDSLVRLNTEFANTVDLDELDPDSEFGEMRTMIEMGSTQVQEAIRSAENLVSSFRAYLLGDGSGKDDTNSNDQTVHLERRQLNQNTDSDTRFTFDKASEDEESFNSNYQDSHSHRQFHRRAQQAFHAHSGGMHSSHHMNAMHGFGEAIVNGDMSAAFSHMFPYQQTNSGVNRRDAKGRRLAAHPDHTRRLSKSEQCKLLVQCADGMSLYDQFVYYFSDDIDKNTGKLDDNIIHFDEAKFDEKRKAIKAAVAAAKDGDDASCNSLLQLFHRTVEKGSIPSWEGASVSQVCLAEGTTQYVKFSSIFEGLVGKPSYSESALAAWKTKLTTVKDKLTKDLAVEPFQCAERLFYNRPQKSTDVEAFPYGGCKGKGDSKKCEIDKYQFPMGYDISSAGASANHYVKRPDGKFKCDSTGLEVITTFAQCKEAGLQLGGKTDSKGDLWIKDNDEGYPCGCFIQKSDKGIYFNAELKCGTTDYSSTYNVLCAKGKVAKRKKPDKYSATAKVKECETGQKKVSSVLECISAGKSLGGHIDTDGKLWVYDSSSYPCGCFLDSGNAIMFNAAEGSGCGASSSYRKVCGEYNNRADADLFENAARDIHGKLFNNDNSAYSVSSYATAKEGVDACLKTEVAKIDAACKGSDWKGAEYYKCVVKKTLEAHNKCDIFAPMQKGIELVFGAKTSPGFICGITQAIVDDGVSMPGSCCLDAPYELEGDSWGQPYSCSAKCKNPGPYLAGINAEACDANGGTWCPAPKANCARLQTCIQKYIQDAESEGKPAFKTYLANAPKIEDPTKQKQCGKTRRYFGFDALFINDNQICEDIEQLKFTRNFDDLNEFFGSGSGVSKQKSQQEDSSGIPMLTLQEPDRKDSTGSWATKDTSIKWTIFGMQTAEQALQQGTDYLASLKCPCDGFCILENICGSMKNTALTFFQGLLTTLSHTLSIASNLHAVLGVDPGPQASQEETAVVYDNMKSTADYLYEMRKELRSLASNGAKDGEDAGDSKASGSLSGGALTRLEDKLDELGAKLDSLGEQTTFMVKNWDDDDEDERRLKERHPENGQKGHLSYKSNSSKMDEIKEMMMHQQREQTKAQQEQLAGLKEEMKAEMKAQQSEQTKAQQEQLAGLKEEMKEMKRMQKQMTDQLAGALAQLLQKGQA
ncbi:expressed unknown protein [Seminavis robusta]|uniref:Uncharacterized protein n=1 Tax=Seminavis robusta TaxID=568900 RepID=A0A9N8ER74_9STRA|nr:expressed unknown protein [Seminavis robusta]|eukprot:Sro1439_g272790.1 n/a (1251) ;mRNA; r:9308-13731